MNKNSIIFSTTLNFLITSLLLIVSFIFLLSHENFKKNEQIFERYKPIIKMVSGKKFYFDKDFHKNLLDMNYELFESKEEIKNILSNILIAEHLARGDFSLTAGLLSTFSVINAMTQWGSEKIQSTYLPSFANESDIQATFAIQEATPAFNPFNLKTKATSNNGKYSYSIDGEKTLVILGETADLLLVNAELHGSPEVFIVKRDNSITAKKSTAMGMKATETVTLKFNQTPAELLDDEDFNYPAFLDLGNLMWCAMAVGTCEAVKAYCIQYANEHTAFGEPISHRQSVAFMIADMAIEIDAMRMLILNAASLTEAGQAFHREAYLARLLCAEKSMQIGTNGVQILGGHGFTKEHPVERWYRDLRATAILHSGLHA